MKRLFFQKPFKYSYFGATWILVAINVVIFALCAINKICYQYIHAYGSLNVVAVHKYHMYWQFITYMFLHGDISHIFFNMFGLLVFGFQLERVMGSKEFLLFYFVTGTLSGVFSYLVYLFTGQYRVYLIGASGALYAIMFAFAVIYPKAKIYIWGIIPVPAPILVFIYAIIEIGSQFLGRSTNVAHLTHLFGFFAAYLYFVIRVRMNPIKIWKNEYGLIVSKRNDEEKNEEENNDEEL